MELYDAPTAYEPKGANSMRGTVGLTRFLRVDVLIGDQRLMSQIRSSLDFLRAAIRSIDNADHAKERIERGNVDLTIVHLQHADAWSAIAPKFVQDHATCHPIIILCSRVEEVRALRRVAYPLMDILPTAAIRDERFRLVIEGALLRGEWLGPS